MAPYYPTPVKSHLIGIANYLNLHYLLYFYIDLFKEFGIYSETQGWEILRKAKDRRYPDLEIRGRKYIITADDLYQMEEVIW